MRVLLLLLLVSFLTGVSAQVDQNFIGNADTSYVSGFKGTGTVYGKRMRLSAYENSLFEVYAKDTANSHAAVTAESLVFVWGIEYSHPTWQSTTTAPKYKNWGRVVIDTVNSLAADNYTYSIPVMDSSGVTLVVRKYLDTTTITGWLSQCRAYCPYWDVYFRFWARGLTGNQATTYVPVIFQQQRRKAVKVSN
jgi:hypothetical protein